MKTHVHHAVEAALKKCGISLDQMDNIMKKSAGWTWLVLQGKSNSPSLLPLLPEFYRVIREKSTIIMNQLVRDIFQEPENGRTNLTAGEHDR